MMKGYFSTFLFKENSVSIVVKMYKLCELLLESLFFLEYFFSRPQNLTIIKQKQKQTKKRSDDKNTKKNSRTFKIETNKIFIKKNPLLSVFYKNYFAIIIKEH